MSVPEVIKDLARRSQAAVRDPAFRSLPAGAIEKEIRDFEVRTGIIVPIELRDWLRFTNGARIGIGGTLGIHTHNVCDNIETQYEWRAAWRDLGWIPIASDNCGNYYVLATCEEDGPGHPVFFIDQQRQTASTQKPTYICASDLWHFLEFYLRDELGESGWPHNKDRVLQDDPALGLYSRIPRPWEVETEEGQPEHS
jgi:hypothetical protein